jgi:tetratricopeptide (TPR) repeat protein
VLASEARPDKQGLPWETTIPIGGNIEGLYFIDGLAYGGGDGQVILYQVQYADGSSADIPIIGGKNIRDWANKDSGAFTHERETKTVAAWTGKCRMFSPITLYMTLWVNPQPDKAVTAVRFSTPTRGPVVGLMGLTAVVTNDAKEAPPELAKAQELFKKAQQSIQAGKTDDAKALLKKAIAASPDMSAAYQALADLCERTQKEDEALEVYRQWTRAGARTPLPWNRLGEILEKRKDYKGALEAYTQSLKVEWNQPPALEAKARLEKLVQP